MKKFLPILLMALAFSVSGCDNGYIDYERTNNIIGADFTYEVDGMSVYFVSRSSSCLDVFAWNFGDGDFALGGNTHIHTYKAYGTYDVRLACVDPATSTQYHCTQKVTIKK